MLARDGPKLPKPDEDDDDGFDDDDGLVDDDGLADDEDDL